MEQLGGFHGPNLGYALELYERYRTDPASLDTETRRFFKHWRPTQPSVPASASPPALDVLRVVGAARLARMTREYGHLAARVDPLGSEPPGDPELSLERHGLTEQDLVNLPSSVVGGPLEASSSNALEAVRQLQEIYSSTVGYDFDQVQLAEEREWLRDSIESRSYLQQLDSETERELLRRLTMAETFEHFLHRTFPGQKWFSVEGLDMLVPMLHEIVLQAATTGTREVVMGIAHRGRLNVLAHVLGQTYENVLGGFVHSSDREKGTAASDSHNDGWTGDVKYHLGATRRLAASGSSVMPITLVSNPSHLEYVNPVVEGRARAAQEDRSQPGPPTQDEQASLPILIHGDAAFPGQGVVSETLNLSRLRGYRTGGTVHIIANNQLGFTTDEREARSTLYASDLAKGFEIPIVHVNADDAAACLGAARLAHAYRERFQKDFLIDLIGYRRYGHNESDEPSFTQPLMYERIRQHPSVRQIWANDLLRRGVVESGEPEAMVKRAEQRLREAYDRAEAPVPLPAPTDTAGIERPTPQPVPLETLRELNEALLRRPQGFQANAKLDRLLQRRRQVMEAGRLDWAHAEALAFATVLAEGVPIRLTGQDTERGTFSQRHLVLHDAHSGQTYTPLQKLPQAKASFAVHNSPLSEVAVLGFEYGYSAHAPGTLVLWEAQYGDFANSAQVIVDQFLVSGEAKWRQRSGLVLLLPHGYEGQGPEHSSARPERFLQLAADENIRVTYPTTAAQYFHLLRRQAALLRADPRPLVVMTPKRLLRSPVAASRASDLAHGEFETVLPDPTEPDPTRVRTLILCAGKVYEDLVRSPGYEDRGDLAILRLEELYPFPEDHLSRALSIYSRGDRALWVQEEPCNMGAWSFVAPLLRRTLAPRIELGYVGRPGRASPAEGSLQLHNEEQSRIVSAALRGETDFEYESQPEGVMHAR